MGKTNQERDEAIELLEARVDLLNSLTAILLRRSFNNASLISDTLAFLEEGSSRSALTAHAFEDIIGELSRDIPVAFRDI